MKVRTEINEIETRKQQTQPLNLGPRSFRRKTNLIAFGTINKKKQEDLNSTLIDKQGSITTDTNAN